MDIIETPFKSYPSIYCQSHEPDQCIICALKLYWQHFYVFLFGTSLAHVDNPIEAHWVAHTLTDSKVGG